MTNDVWEFKTYSNGKVELVGRMQPKDLDPTKLPGASHTVLYHEHLLEVRSSSGFVEKCRTCDTVSLTKGQLCEVIDKYNDEKHPL